MEAMIAYCGLDCSQCPAFLATRNNDDAAREKVARDWSRLFGMELKPEQINCDGCRSESERKIGHCSDCKIRFCGAEKGVENCAFCDDGPCDALIAFLKYVPQARENLESVRNQKQ